jgi:lysophospholipase L1-like esterase
VLRTFEFLADWVWRQGIRKVLPPGHRERVPPAEFDENIRAMLDATQRAGAEAIVLLPPYSSSLLARKPILRRYQEILRQEAIAHGVPFSELQPLFAQHDEASLYHADRIHPNATGHHVIGDEIARLAREADLVPGRPTGG